jgi:type I restriction enzyme S subunit
VRGFPVPLAPLNEQKRIADKLDSILAKVDACRERLAGVPDILKRFRQAVLAAACSGQLAQGNRDHWERTVLKEVCRRDRIITYGVIKLGNDYAEGVPCLRTSDVRWLRINTKNTKRISPAISKEYSRTVLQGGEVLVNVRGTLGGVAVATFEMAGWNVSREIAVVPVNAS